MISRSILVKQFLSGIDSTLYSLVADNIVLMRRRPTWGDDQKCIVWMPLPGDVEWEVEEFTFDAVFVCYGGSNNFEDAEEIARALHDRLHAVQNQTVDEGFLLSAEEVGAGEPSIDKDDERPAWVTTYAIQCRAKAQS